MTSRTRSGILRVGAMLVSGPETIHQADAVGNRYLASSTMLRTNDASFSTFRSCRIYCDACGDDESGYLSPLARIAKWNRAADLRRPELDWPNVEICLLEIDLDCSVLQNEIVNLQKRLDTNVLTSYGLPTRRNFGDSEFGSGGMLQIETCAGWQRLSREFLLAESPQFADVFESVWSVVENVGQVVTNSQWIERHEHSPEILSTGKWWDWDYKPRTF